MADPGKCPQACQDRTVFLATSSRKTGLWTVWLFCDNHGPLERKSPDFPTEEEAQKARDELQEKEWDNGHAR